MKRAFLILCALLIGAPAFAQERSKATFNTNYDLDATSYTYCVTSGQNADPWGPPRVGQTPVETTGSSATVTAVTASTNPFLYVAVGDVLFFKLTGAATTIRYVTARASADSITVSSAIDLDNSAGNDGSGTGFAFTWMEVNCGTAATDGWIGLRGRKAKIVTYIENLSVDAGGMDFRWECRDQSDDTNIITVYPETNYAAEDGVGPGGRAVVIEEAWDECRVGMKLTDDDATDTGADIEQVHAWIVVWR